MSEFQKAQNHSSVWGEPDDGLDLTSIAESLAEQFEKDVVEHAGWPEECEDLLANNPENKTLEELIRLAVANDMTEFPKDLGERDTDEVKTILVYP